ncbi:ThiF family adenylyltransferase [Micromonospora sp. WMMD812]|uniref:HesA/MoeB/ThiF family protein n=1 Tax=Micromonospora sp. WMMD812 TaxID=3015152 RepID=UPI00248C8E8A|nr:ThiF family adenylyltransferase [Micromonospora sp. WMMD812]WBB69358.1 ThiF family adenylyltransferase [Micromonospora sp. WMMD812]
MPVILGARRCSGCGPTRSSEHCEVARMRMLRPRVKLVHEPYTLPGNRLTIGLMQYGVAAEIQDDEDGTVARLLTLLDGTRDLAEVSRDLAVTHPGLSEESVRAAVEQLIGQGFIEDAAAPLPSGFSPEAAERYDRARHFFSWIDTTPRASPYAAQARIGQARVGLLGLGGTGTAVAAGLVASGVGGLHCVDFDVVDQPNLTRQLLYTESDVGQPKVNVAVERLRAMNSQVAVTGEEREVRSAADVAALMDGCDAFVLCADKPVQLIQSWTNEAALRTRVPWFMALYTGPMTVVGSFLPYRTGCYTCLSRRPGKHEFHTDGRPLIGVPRPNAVIAASANITGHLCALEVLYHLAGLPQQVAGRVYHQSVARWDHQYFVDVPHDSDCPSCGSRSESRT